jgi:ABC-type multidrug transport system permease subunit
MQNRLNPWTLESILMAGPKSATLVLGTSIWPYALALIFLIPQLFIGVFLFGAVLKVNILSFVLATLISTTIVFSLAMIGTGVKIVTKMADPFTVSLGVAASLLAGMTYPVSYLNNYIPGLSTVALLIPQTWIYNIMRLSTLTDASILNPAVAQSFLGALVFAAVLLPISYYVFNISIRRAKTDGTLGWQ